MRTKDSAKQSAILDKALRLFLSSGPAAVSMADIANASGLAVGTVYLYFTDKAVLARECLKKHLGEHASQADKIFSGTGDTRTQLTAYLKKRFDSHRRLRSGKGSAEFCRYVMDRFPDAREREADLMAQAVMQKLLSAHKKKLIRLRHPKKDVQVFLLSLAWFFPLPTDEYRAEPQWNLCESTIHWFFDVWEQSA